METEPQSEAQAFHLGAISVKLDRVLHLLETEPEESPEAAALESAADRLEAVAESLQSESTELEQTSVPPPELPPVVVVEAADPITTESQHPAPDGARKRTLGMLHGW